MANATTKTLHFDVSSGLKSVLGSELITNDEVAVFELVKNSFDADAKRVDLFFGDHQIVISDDGVGMSYQDIETKWLFVAYSAKRDINRSGDFRDDISERRNYAGSKGIGRFSSDRLGQIIRLQTRPVAASSGPVHSIAVDWALFDQDHQKHFDDVRISYTAQDGGFLLPTGVPKISHGTAITIEKTRQIWDRAKILRLKSALAKLINPFGAATDGFRIVIHAPAELRQDKLEQSQASQKGDELTQNALVNGECGVGRFKSLWTDATQFRKYARPLSA